MDLYQFIAWIIAMFALAVGWQALGPLGLIVLVAVVVTAITLGGVAAGRRAARARQRIEPRFQPTGEVYRDSRTGAVTRVFQDPATGERRYGTDESGR